MSNWYVAAYDLDTLFCYFIDWFIAKDVISLIGLAANYYSLVPDVITSAYASIAPVLNILSDLGFKQGWTASNNPKEKLFPLNTSLQRI